MTATNPFAPPKANLDAPTEAGVAPPLWNPDAAGLWSLLLTPIFGATLVMKNWQAIGDDERARGARNWLIGNVLILIPAAFIPGGGLIWIITWYLMSQRKQTQYIRERWGKEYPRRGWGLPLLCGFGVLAGIWLLIFLVVMAAQR